MKQLTINVPDDMDAIEVAALLGELLDAGFEGFTPLCGLEVMVSESFTEAVENAPVDWPTEIWVGEVLILKNECPMWSYVECYAWDQVGATNLAKAAAAKRAKAEKRPFGWRVIHMVNGKPVEYYDWLDEKRES